MRASELLGAPVIDADGRSLGPVRDLRVTPNGLEVVGLVVGNGRLAGLAHAWGYAEGRARGPWLLRALMASAARSTRFIAASQVADWGPGPVRITASAHQLPHLTDALQP